MTGTLNVGYGPLSNGTYSLSGNARLSAQNEAVGVQGAGSLLQTGGTNSSAIFISNSGSYSISGGLLQNTGDGATFVLDNSFQQSGGTINVSPNGFLLLTASAAFGLSGSGQLSSKSELIGYGGSGVFTQAGGTNSVTGVSFGFTGLILGYDSGDNGTYNLNGGLLDACALSAGSGAAAFNFGGGTLGAVGSFSSSLNMTLTGSGGNATINTTGGNISLAGILSGSGGLTKNGSGTLILSGESGYPANSPNVIAVGGTTLNTNGNNWSSETAWSGSCGGEDTNESEPKYQRGVQSTGYRETPDVSFDANPGTGVSIYVNGAMSSGYLTGGTSLATPCWAGVIAIVDQLRVSLGRLDLGRRHADAADALQSPRGHGFPRHYQRQQQH